MTQMKGQSAIEYLTTYGWMLLVIAIVGGAIFTTVQNSSDIQQSEFSSDDLEVSNFALDSSGELQMEIESTPPEEVTIKEVEITGPDSDQETQTATNDSYSQLIEAGESQSVEFTSVSEADSSNEFDVQIVYDAGELTNITANGTINANMYLAP